MKNIVLSLFFLLFLTGCPEKHDNPYIDLSWNKNSPSEQITLYKIYKKNSGEDWSLVGQTSSLMYLEKNLEYGKYEYRVTATNIWGESNYSESAIVYYQFN